MTVFDRIKTLCSKKGIKIAELERIVGVAKNASYKWKEYNPSGDTLYKLSEYFGVSSEYILTGKEPDEGYYADKETEQLAEELMNNKELKALFDVVKDMPKDRLEAIYNLLKE